jgi:hypothetical protein
VIVAGSENGGRDLQYSRRVSGLVYRKMPPCRARYTVCCMQKRVVGWSVAVFGMTGKIGLDSFGIWRNVGDVRSDQRLIDTDELNVNGVCG